jgi:hypothetical protein
MNNHGPAVSPIRESLFLARDSLEAFFMLTSLGAVPGPLGSDLPYPDVTEFPATILRELRNSGMRRGHDHFQRVPNWALGA